MDGPIQGGYTAHAPCHAGSGRRMFRLEEDGTAGTTRSMCLAGSDGWMVWFRANGTIHAPCRVRSGMTDGPILSGVISGMTGSPDLPEPERLSAKTSTARSAGNPYHPK